MLDPNARVSEQLALLAAINPASQGAGSVSTGWIAARDYQKFLGVVSVGAFGASATVDALIQQATDSSGTGAKTAKAITQLVAAGGNNRQAMIDLDQSELDIKNNFTHIRLTVTVATAATLIAGGLWGACARYEPVTQATTVAEVKT